jgi:hypothetical protein
MIKSVVHILEPQLLGSKNQEDINILVPRKKTQADTDRLADYLVDQFKAPEYRNAFLRIAWRLDDGTIQRLAGTAKELGKNPRAYFITIARNELRRRGIAV